jgi:hypothetical protein
LRERFARVPYIQFSKGDDFGLVGFDKALTEDEIDYVKTNLKTVNSNEVQWSIPEGTVTLTVSYTICALPLLSCHRGRRETIPN